MKVFKFGGASVKDTISVKNVARILKQYPGQNMVVVLSAMGKMTNVFEDLTDAYFYNENTLAEKFHLIKRFHLQIVQELFNNKASVPSQKISDLFKIMKGYLDQPAEYHYKNREHAAYDFIYDQLVSYGELISTTILSEFLNQQGIFNQWLDVRELIYTDTNYREANINWEKTLSKIQAKLLKESASTKIYITQGFIGGTSDNTTTTLGREGSDFTAAIFGYALNAQTVTIWKDVPGLLNADPRYLENTRKIDRISYREAIELAYYGAKIIHPKTIKPLQNSKIPLFVKSFANPEAQGTIITDNTKYDKRIPTYIFTFKQVVLSVTTRDYSFITESHLHELYGIFASNKIKINMMQNSAISLSICFDHQKDRINQLFEELGHFYHVRYNENIELITIRHYNQEAIDKVSKHKKVLLEQRSRITLQLAVEAHYSK